MSGEDGVQAIIDRAEGAEVQSDRLAEALRDAGWWLDEAYRATNDPVLKVQLWRVLGRTSAVLEGHLQA